VTLETLWETTFELAKAKVLGSEDYLNKHLTDNQIVAKDI
jgi:hypothetical protein